MQNMHNVAAVELLLLYYAKSKACIYVMFSLLLLVITIYGGWASAYNIKIVLPYNVFHREINVPVMSSHEYIAF